jgi:hypothetical protein
LSGQWSAIVGSAPEADSMPSRSLAIKISDACLCIE